ncbi:MAG TPA: thymidine phosphorylase, partial [Gemmatimonadales bacterium]|nr:thymidine phosphorylase [Gemmatimonadales bacterium]
MVIPALIEHKRDGAALSPEQWSALIRAYAAGQVPDYQMSALLMAIYFRGLEPAELTALTDVMIDSGDRLRFDGLPIPVADKHSTGGVGDKVSLLLAPIVAACGGQVPMISGRGLGHTGGTLDKLQSIPGYDVAPDNDRLRAAVAGAGCAIIGQTGDLAPADRRLYAIRDATGTVESIPLIVASILSKKLAAGLSALVMDVKVGSGAFLPDRESAQELAQAIVEVAQGNGLPTSALLTDMDRVLGRTAGNAVEVREAIDHLTGARTDDRLRSVTLALCEELLRLGGIEGADPAQALDSGAAAERFERMVSELGGPSDILGRDHLPHAPVTIEAFPDEAGVLERVDVRAVGVAIIGLGGGRARETDEIDHAVGLTEVAAPGERVG